MNSREREVWRCLQVSKSVCIARNYDLKQFSKKLQRKLAQAKEVRYTENCAYYDYEPEVKGCCQETRDYGNYGLEHRFIMRLTTKLKTFGR